MNLFTSSRLLFSATILAFSSSMSACYPSPGSLTTEDLDVVATVFDKDVDFSANHTFSMPDSVIHLTLNEDSDEISREFDDLILTEVAKGLTDMGYERDFGEDPDNPADVIVFVSVTTTQWAGYVSYPWYGGWGWWGGWPGYGPGWGPGYPWYPSGGAVYTYETGTVLVDMVDPGRADEGTEEIGTTWIGALNGLLTSSSTGTASRLRTGIRQMYSQSPYLKPGS